MWYIASKPSDGNSVKFANYHTDNITGLIQKGTTTTSGLHWRRNLQKSVVVAEPGQSTDCTNRYIGLIG